MNPTHRSGEVVPAGEYSSVAHTEPSPCHLPARQLSAPLGKVTLPKCRCGGNLIWQAAPGGHAR
jgi:hypothetical protein